MVPKQTMNRFQDRGCVQAWLTSIYAGGARWSHHLGDRLLKMMRADGTACWCELIVCSPILFIFFFTFPHDRTTLRYESTWPDAVFFYFYRSNLIQVTVAYS
jgi:hypothetical protein